MWFVPSRNSLVRWAASINWPLVIIIIGFIVLVPLYKVWVQPISWLAAWLLPGSMLTYEASIRDAAVKSPDYNKGITLATIDPKVETVSVAAFKTRAPQSPLPEELWVALPEQLKRACAGTDNTAQALQQILGLPPGGSPRFVFMLTVKRKDMFRPCMGQDDLSASICSDKVPLVEKGSADSLQPDELNKAYKELRQAYERLYFTANHLWQSYQIGGAAQFNFGYPFTGFGWTYDWTPSSTKHFGVTEFVVHPHAEITVDGSINPDTFCAAQQ